MYTTITQFYHLTHVEERQEWESSFFFFFVVMVVWNKFVYS